MATLFECWNGGTIQWNRVTAPQFVFGFPSPAHDIVQFFQVSGRICEVLTRTEWHLNMGGQVLDIPNLPEYEITQFVVNVRNTMGYTATVMPYQLGNVFTGYVTIPVVLWVSLQTGRADMFTPAAQLVYGRQFLVPQQQYITPWPQANMSINMSTQGGISGSGGKNFMQSMATIVGGLGKIADFLGKTEWFTPGSDY